MADVNKQGLQHRSSHDGPLDRRDGGCDDPMKLMPLCQSCIPGLVRKNWVSDQCELSPATHRARDGLFRIASNRG